MSQPVFHRLHPGTILISMVQASRNLIVPIIYVGFSCIRGAKTDGSIMTELMGAGIGLLVGAMAVFRYYNYGYAIHEGNLIVRDGWFTKKIRTIPLDRIQNINLKRGLLHRVMNLVDMEIETAGGATAEASLSALSEDNARRLKVLLTGESHLSMSPVMAARQDPLVYAASTKELFLAGATQNRALTIVATILGTFAFLIQDAVEDTIKSFVRSSSFLAQMNWWTMASFALVALIVVGWVASIVMSFITYWGFELRRNDDRLKRTYGMINHVENVILIRRIQVVRIAETLIQRWMKLCSMHVDTAGGLAAAASGQDGQRQAAASANSNLISPLLDDARVPGLLSVVLPGIKVDSPDWQPVSPRSILRRTRLALHLNVIWAAVLGFGIYVARLSDANRKAVFNPFNPDWQSVATHAAITYVVLCLLSWLKAYLLYRTTRWWDQGDVFVSRTGVLGRNTWYAPIAKIQSIQIAQSPGQRRLGLATLTFRTAAMHGSAAVEVQDVASDIADTLAASLHRRSAEHAWMNPDGF